MMQQLSLAANFWRAEGLLADAGEEGEMRVWEVVKLYGYVIAANAEAWRQVSAGLGVEPDALLRLLPGYEASLEAERAAERWGFTPEEADAYLTRKEGKERKAVRAEEYAEAMRGLLDRVTEWWD
jgi:hypothetical protein